MNYCIDLILGKAFCIFIFFHFPDSRLSVLKGSHFYFAFSFEWKPRINPSNHWGILYKQTPKWKKINGNWFSYKVSLQLIAIQLCCFWRHKIPALDQFKLNFSDKAVKKMNKFIFQNTHENNRLFTKNCSHVLQIKVSWDYESTIYY